MRQKVKEMVEFVQDDDRLREERKKAKKNRDKYIGVSSDSMGDYRYGKSCSQERFPLFSLSLTYSQSLTLILMLSRDSHILGCAVTGELFIMCDAMVFLCRLSSPILFSSQEVCFIR